MMKLYFQTLSVISRIADKQRGATMPEYGLMVALIAVVCVVAVGAIGTRLNDVFGTIRDALPAN